MFGAWRVRSPSEIEVGDFVCEFLANISAEMEVGTYRVFAWIFCFYMLCQNLVWLFSFYVSVKNVICLSCFFALV